MALHDHNFTRPSISPWQALANAARAGDDRALEQLIYEAAQAGETLIATEAQCALDGEGFDELDRVLDDGGEDYENDPEADRADYYHETRVDGRSAWGMGA